MSASRLDAVYRSILITKFFTKGWGKPENLRRLFEFRKVVSNRDECFKLIDRDYPVTITKDQHLSDCRLLEGYFMSPLERFLPGIVPEVVQQAHFQVILPIHWPEPHCKPMCLHFAGTGDHFFWRRRNLMVKPLLKEAGIGGIILENPFYGLRKPTDQIRSSLHNVSDIFVMGGCLILEALVLFHWCERNGLGPLGVTGLSMGGHMASLAATNWPKPLVLVPCLSWSTASAVFLQGVMSHSINWDLLEDQYLSDGIYREKLSKMVTIVDEAFLAGKKFARSFSTNIDETTQNKKPQTNTENSQTKQELNQDKKVDVTYNETSKETDSDNKVENAEVPTVDPVLQTLNADLKRLLMEGKVNQALYNKLTSNARFELDAKDIADINNLTEIKDLLKNKVAELKNTSAPLETDQESSDDKHFDDLSKPNLITSAEDNKNILKNTSNEIILSDIANLKDTSLSETATEPLLCTTENKETALEIKKKIHSKAEKRSWHVSDFTADLWTNLPFRRPERKIDISKIHWRDREALQFMRGIMDECTHLSNFSVPFDTSLIIAVCAKHDAYVPREDVGTLEEIWPGAEVRYVDAGHVSAYILHQSVFRSCIKEAFERSKKRWQDGKHID